MPRDLFARLNTLICVMDWRWPSSPVARALASSSGTPNASTASAPRRNSVTRTSERRFGMFIRIFPEERADRFLPALRFLHEWIAASRTQPEEENNEGGAARYGATYGRASPPRKQARREATRAASQPNTLPQPCAAVAVASKDGPKARTCSKRLVRTVFRKASQKS